MNKMLIAFFEKLESTYGTHKLMKCGSVAVINFLILLMIVPNDQKPEVVNDLIENNKEEF